MTEEYRSVINRWYSLAEQMWFNLSERYRLNVDFIFIPLNGLD